MGKKISQLTAISGSTFADADLFEISVSSGGAFVSRKITGAQIKATIPSGITINSTTVTSGTSGRVLFENTGVVKESANFYWDDSNARLSLGQGSSPGAVLDVRAAGATTGAIAFRIRNSADTFDLFKANGLGCVWSNGVGGASGSTAFGENTLSTRTTGTANTAFGDRAGNILTTGSNNTFVGYRAGGGVLASSFTGSDNTIVGAGAGLYLSSGIQNTFIGNNAGTSITTGSYNTIIGMNGTSFPTGFAQNIVISDGSGAVGLWKNSSHFVGFGYAPATDTLGAKVDIKAQGSLSTDIVQRWRNSANSANLGQISGDGAFTFGTYTNPSTRLSVTGGSVQGAYITGLGTAIYVQNETSTGTAYAAQFLGRQYGSGSPSGYNAYGILTGADTTNGINYGIKSYAYNGATNYAAYLDATAGTTNWALYIQRGDILLGTATTNKIGFWNATPIVQPTTAVGSATITSPGAGSNLKSDDTFDGYTLAQVVKALRNLGILA